MSKGRYDSAKIKPDTGHPDEPVGKQLIPPPRRQIKPDSGHPKDRSASN